MSMRSSATPAVRDYKAGAPQSVTTTAAAHTQNVALRYGYTTTMSGLVTDCLSVSSCSNRNGATVIGRITSSAEHIDRAVSKIKTASQQIA